MRAISLEWLYNVDKDKHERVAASLRTCSPLVNQTLRILDKWEEELDAQETKLSDFDNPSWACRQAFRSGDRSRIRRIRELFNSLKEG